MLVAGYIINLAVVSVMLMNYATFCIYLKITNYGKTCNVNLVLNNGLTINAV